MRILPASSGIKYLKTQFGKIMPRLKVHDPPQQGVSTGAPRVHGDSPEPRKRKRTPVEAPLGADRESRAKAQLPKKQRLSADEHALLSIEYKELPPRKQRGSRGLGRLANLDKFEEQILEAFEDYPSEKLDDLY